MTEKKREDVSKKLVGLSNSRLKYPNLGRIDENDEFRCSVDRITLMAPLSVEAWEKHFFKWLHLPFIETAGAGLQVLDYSNCDVDDFGNPHPHVAPEQVAYMEMTQFQHDKVRIDFNPNHGMNSEGGLWLKDLLSKLPRKTFSRADIAIDILHHPEIYKYGVWNFGTSKRIFLDKGGKMETTYWGKSSSKKQIRLYNKKVEQEKRHGRIVNLDEWWRLEMQLRGDKVAQYPQLVKEMLEHFYIPDYKSSLLKDNEQNKLLRMMIDQSYYGSLPKTSKQRLREIVKKAKPENSLSILMAKKFVEDLPSLENELYSYLGRFHIEKATVNDEEYKKLEGHQKLLVHF